MRALRDLLSATDPEVSATLTGEETRQRLGIELIPSENYTYPEVLAVLGSVFTNKYSEGHPGRRDYGGQKCTETVEHPAGNVFTVPGRMKIPLVFVSWSGTIALLRSS
ncbi:MAG: hypothetical protein RDU30_12395 [Desulfovibrionaceae bacterium]|nr:hypothetical protein [Desulfovibrionaceae bacterium]